MKSIHFLSGIICVLSFCVYPWDDAFAVRIKGSSKYGLWISDELGFSVGGGISAMFLKGTSESIPVNINPGSNINLSLDYSHFFHPRWSVSSGLSLDHRFIIMKSEDIIQTKDEFYFFQGFPTEITVEGRLDNWSEYNQFLNLSAMVMVGYNTEDWRSIQYYIQAGVKLGWSVWNSYSAQAKRLVILGIFEEFGQVLEDIPAHEFVSQNNVKYKGRSVFPKPHYSAVIETGIKYDCGNNAFLYVGFFADYGITNVPSKNRQKMLVSYSPDNLRDLSYMGLFRTDFSKNGGMNMLSVGIKFRFAFGL
jgi:hypothetical protein